MNRYDELVDKYNRTGMLTPEELTEMAKLSGKVKWMNQTEKHVSIKALNQSGVIYPAKGEIPRDVLREIIKAFRRCGFFVLALAVFLKLAGAI